MHGNTKLKKRIGNILRWVGGGRGAFHVQFLTAISHYFNDTFLLLVFLVFGLLQLTAFLLCLYGLSNCQSDDLVHQLRTLDLPSAPRDAR